MNMEIYIVRDVNTPCFVQQSYRKDIRKKNIGQDKIRRTETLRNFVFKAKLQNYCS